MAVSYVSVLNIVIFFCLSFLLLGEELYIVLWKEGMMRFGDLLWKGER